MEASRKYGRDPREGAPERVLRHSAQSLAWLQTYLDYRLAT
jgi:hypothetical protein